MRSVSTPSSASVREALERVSLLRENDFTAKAVRTVLSEVEGRTSKEEGSTTNDSSVQHRVHFRSSSQSDKRLRDANAPKISTPPSLGFFLVTRRWRLFVVSLLQKGKEEGTTGKCVDDGTRLVKKLSGRLPRKLQRGASLVNGGLSSAIQTVSMRQLQIDVILSKAVALMLLV